MVEKAESLESKFNDSKYTEPEAIQTSGEATYSGSLVVSKNDFSPMAVDSVEKIAAAIDLTAKFDTNSSTVAGKLHNFRTQNDATIAGELSIESTTVAHGNPIQTGISGELQFGQDSDEVKGELNAHYIGAAAEGIWGEIYLDADEYGEWSGEFIAEK